MEELTKYTAIELEPGKHYILEIDERTVRQSDIRSLVESLIKSDVFVHAITSLGGDSVRVVPQEEKK